MSLEPREGTARLVPVGEGWAQSSINAAIFRRHAVTSAGDTQYTAYYDPGGRVVLARRRLTTAEWEVSATELAGDVRDAHNAISLAIDGEGDLHLAWGVHGASLRYVRARRGWPFELVAQDGMTRSCEDRVTYPQFHNLPGGDLLFAYRNGSSGDGDVLLNRYRVATGIWSPVQHPLIDGEGARNAYLNQLVVDHRGWWHVSWCWRESADVATNHDIAYARSRDEGRTWEDTNGEALGEPITVSTAEYARIIPQGSDLMNQTSMAVDARGRPLIATYWRPEGSEVPQYHLVWHDGGSWRISRIGERSTPFRLSGRGTKHVPISRPLILADEDSLYVVFRDVERGGGVSVGVCRDRERSVWSFLDLVREPVGQWEPTHDADLWAREGLVHLFHQHVDQGDGDTLGELTPQTVSILEWEPHR